MDSGKGRSYAATREWRESVVQLFTFWRSLATFRVRIALNIKGLSAEPVYVDLLKGQQHSTDFRAVNPQMVVPALIDGAGPALFQSLAIIEYLDEVHPRPPLLPSDPRARARVRGLAQIVACDTHPLLVPRIRSYLERELELDEAQRMRWIRHWIHQGLAALEAHLANEPGTGRYCQGDSVTIADICLASQVVGARFFECELTGYPTATRIVDACLKEDAFAAAHPLRQPDAPPQHQ
jgi:maleylacetoacetate isomerase